MMDLIVWLFDWWSFVPRDRCGDWGPWLPFLSQCSALVFGTAYMMIPVALLWLYHKRKDKLPASWMLLFFCAFIFFCGMTHYNNFLSFWFPAYRAMTLLVQVPGALISIITAFMLPRVVLYVASLPTPAEYAEALLNERQRTAELLKVRIELEKQNKELYERCESMEAELDHLEWRQEVGAELSTMRQHVKAIKESAS